MGHLGVFKAAGRPERCYPLCTLHFTIYSQRRVRRAQVRSGLLANLRILSLLGGPTLSAWFEPTSARPEFFLT